MLLEREINIGKLSVQNRLVMPPMQTNKTEAGHVTDAPVDYYRERAVGSRPGIIITEHSCVASNARAAETQLSIATDDMIPEHRRLTDAIHEGGCKAFVQLNHAGSNGIDEPVSASNVNIPTKKLSRRPRELTVNEIHTVMLDLNKARLFTESYYRNNLQKRFSFTLRGEVPVPTATPEPTPAPAPAPAPNAAPTSVPKTGDGANLGLWAVMAGLGIIGIILFTGKRGRHPKP